MGLLFSLCLVYAMLSDVASMTIPNRLCLLLAALFPVSALLAGAGLSVVAIHLLLGVAAIALLLPLFAFGWMGGGDVKLIAAIAVWFGPNPELSEFAVRTALYGGLLTLGLMTLRLARRPDTGIAFVDRLLAPASGVPYGVAIALAGLASYPGPILPAV